MILQPGPLEEGVDYSDPEFLPPAELELFKGQPRQQALDDEKERLRLLDQARREFELEQQEAQLSGTLSPDAQLFLDGTLKPRLSEIHEFEQQVRTPIVQGVLFQNTVAWVAGPSGTFKSFITADLAFRYGAEDMDYHGRRMTTGRTLLVIAEGGGGYADRRAAWEKEYGREVKNVVIYPAPLQLPDTLREMPALLSYLKEEDEAGRPFTLVVFDTQAMCTVGIDENKSEINLVINMLHRLREISGACILTVHHFGKNDKSGMRGSSMLYAAADTVVIIEREKGEMEVTLTTGGEHGKQKDAPAEDDFLTLRLNSHVVGVDYFGDPLTSLAPVQGGAVGHDTSETPDDSPVALPDLTGEQMAYLKALGYFEDKGTSPSGLMALMNHEAGDKVTTGPNTRNFLVALGKKGVAVQPVPKGPWFITPIGVSVIARELMDAQRVGEGWVERGRRRVVSGAVSEGQENLLVETIETTAKPDAKPSLTCDETETSKNET